MTDIGYHINRIFTPWCQNSYPKGPIFNRKTYSIATQWFPMCQFGFENYDTQIGVQI